MKNLKNLKGANELSKKEQKSINGGFVPTPWQFCCTHTQGFWLQTYSGLGLENIDCSNVNCGISGDPRFDLFRD